MIVNTMNCALRRGVQLATACTAERACSFWLALRPGNWKVRITMPIHAHAAQVQNGVSVGNKSMRKNSTGCNHSSR
jgi:hypothetical protein